MTLLTDTLRQELPPLYSQEDVDDPVVLAHFFMPGTGWDWWAIEYDPKDRLFFGLVRGFYTELGYFSQDELESVKGPMGLPVERDTGWRPRPLSRVMGELR